MDDSVSNLGDAENSASIDFSLLSGANATFIAEMNKAWRENPSSVDPIGQLILNNLRTADSGADIEAGPSWGRQKAVLLGLWIPRHQ